MCILQDPKPFLFKLVSSLSSGVCLFSKYILSLSDSILLICMVQLEASCTTLLELKSSFHSMGALSGKSANCKTVLTSSSAVITGWNTCCVLRISGQNFQYNKHEVFTVLFLFNFLHMVFLRIKRRFPASFPILFGTVFVLTLMKAQRDS